MKHRRIFGSLHLVFFGLGIAVKIAGAFGETPPGPSTRMVAVGDAASVSPDGSFITFTDWNTGKIMLRDLGTGEARPLTQGGYPDYGMYAQISPDGERVAYSWRVHGGHFDLRVVGLDGSSPTVLRAGNDDGETYFVRDWSPDGKKILARTSHHLALVSVSDGNVETLDYPEERLYGEFARFSPDGKTIAFGIRSDATGDQSRGIALYSIEQDEVVDSSLRPSNNRLIDWMPDGRWIISSSDRGGSYGLSATPVFDERLGDPIQLLESLGGDSPWSIGVTQGGAAFYSIRTWENDLFIADCDLETGTLGKPILLVSHVNYGSAPAWAPDGQSLVYSRPRTLVIRSFPEGSEREIRYGLRRFHSIQPQWSSDGTSIMLGARYEGSSAGLIAVDTRTAEVTPLIRDKNRSKTKVEWATGSPNEIAYIPFYDVGESGRIIERDMRTGSQRELFSFESQLPDGLQPVHMLALAPDGKLLAYLERSGEAGEKTVVRVRAVLGEEPKELFRVAEPQVIYQPAWAPSSRSLLFGVGSTNDTDSELTIWQADIDSGNTRQLKGFRLSGRNMGGLSIHPDGRRIAFTAGRIYPEGVGKGAEVRDEVRVVENLEGYLNNLVSADSTENQ